MWLLILLRRVLLGFWRLLVGIVIGAVFYVWLFFNHKENWQAIHEWTHDFLAWMMTHPYLADYSQWNTLLNLDDKLAFAFFIMAGRIVWLLIEEIFFKFPYWLIFGRKKKLHDSAPAMTLEERSSAAAQGLSEKIAQSAAPVGAAVTPASALSEASAESVATNPSKLQDKLEENAENLEQSIDEALKMIRQAGQNRTQEHKA